MRISYDALNTFPGLVHTARHLLSKEQTRTVTIVTLTRFEVMTKLRVTPDAPVQQWPAKHNGLHRTIQSSITIAEGIPRVDLKIMKHSRGRSSIG